MGWAFGFLAIILVVLMVLYRRASGNNASSETGASNVNLANLRVTDIQRGDVVTLNGGGDDYADLSFDVDRTNRYQSSGLEWFEHSGLYNGRRIFVEVVNEDFVESFVDLAKNAPALGDLGLGEDDLVRMDDSQDRSESCQFQGHTFRYHDSQEIGYFQDCAGDGEGYYSWEFREVDGERVITVEKWEGEPFEVRIARKVNPNDFEIFRP